MENIVGAPFVMEMRKITQELYKHGWDERNGGNISYLLDEDELESYLDVTFTKRSINIGFEEKSLAGKYFIVTGSGKYFRNIMDNPTETLGIIRINVSGNSADLLWGFENGVEPTSELPSHMMSHASRLKVDSEHRVVIHCHATHLLAMTYTVPLEEKHFTRLLWEMSTECLVVFPEGIGIIPWIVPGATEIGKQTSQKMQDTRLVIWPHHGVYGVGKTIDETFGLIETAEKAAKVYTYTQSQGGIRQSITDEQLNDLAHGFGVTPREGYLNINND